MTLIHRILVSLALVAAVACGGVKTHVSPVADIANAGGKIQESAHAIFEASVKAADARLIPRQSADDVAIAVNRVGHVGLDLKAALDAYTAAKAAGTDLTHQRAAIQQIVDTIVQAMHDVGKAVPPGTLADIDALVNNVLGVVVQIKGGVGL